MNLHYFEWYFQKKVQIGNLPKKKSPKKLPLLEQSCENNTNFEKAISTLKEFFWKL